MGDVVELRLHETVCLDRDQLHILLTQLGPAGAEKTVSQALEILAREVERIEKSFQAGAISTLCESTRGLIPVAQKTGMTTLARVARDVLYLADGSDSAAFCAAVSRLIRIAESSLVAVWELEGISL